MLNHFISLKDLSAKDIMALLALTARIKKNPAAFRKKLAGKTVGLLFQKPSLRTKTSFYVAVLELGASPIYFSPQEVRLGERESVSDAAKTLSRYLDCVVLRTFSHEVIRDFIKVSDIPVINGLSGLVHPAQILGDLFTLYELKKDFKKIKFAYIGDGNNIAHSLLYAFSLLGGNIAIAHPVGYAPEDQIVKEAREFARKSGATIDIGNDPKGAASGADVLYADVWTSMGDEAEHEDRVKIFKDFQLNGGLMQLAKKDCLIMHCLPAHRGEEITDDVIDSKNSVVFDQAENRLHTAKAILLHLLSK
ncbi:MAG: ornithine carbamoyltransferase [Candidatus Omnitrophica bacterium]|nr:ornithine carbamoyltransferase [Candidatus Omnitrophota bacterium]